MRRSFGKVFKALHHGSNRVVAVKIVPLEDDSGEISREVEHLRECDHGLVAGINLMLTPWIPMACALAGMTSPNGHSHTFDNRADGFARAGGCTAPSPHYATACWLAQSEGGGGGTS